MLSGTLRRPYPTFGAHNDVTDALGCVSLAAGLSLSQYILLLLFSHIPHSYPTYDIIRYLLILLMSANDIKSTYLIVLPLYKTLSHVFLAHLCLSSSSSFLVTSACSLLICLPVFTASHPVSLNLNSSQTPALSVSSIHYAPPVLTLSQSERFFRQTLRSQCRYTTE